MNLNLVYLAGGLTKDPELRFLPTGVAVCEWTMALNGARYDWETRQQIVTTTYVSVQAWASLAEMVIETKAKTGDVLYVVGELDQREVEKRDGTKERKTRVTASVVLPVRVRAAPGAVPQSSGVEPPW